MKLGIVTICITTLLLCMGCKKEPKSCDCPTNGNVCTDLPIPALGAYNTGYVFTYDTGYVTYPCFNPNNANEIIFYKPNSPTAGPQLIKFNLQTHQQQVIFSQRLIDVPQWGTNGWILLGLGQVYKIKDNGDSLTQLTFGNANNYAPAWDFAGDKFITEYVGNSYKYIIYNANGNQLDTLPFLFNGVYSWQNPNNLLLVGLLSGYSLGVMNPQTDSIITVPTGNSSSVNDGPILWFPDGSNILYGNSCGVYKVDYVSNTKSCIQLKCQNDQYLYSSISSLSQKIICEIDHSKSLGGASVFISSKLVLMNFDGTAQQVIY